jgi:hypothetical protein
MSMDGVAIAYHLFGHILLTALILQHCILRVPLISYYHTKSFMHISIIFLIIAPWLPSFVIIIVLIRYHSMHHRSALESVAVRTVKTCQQQRL